MHARPSPQGWSQWPVTVSAQAAATSPQVQAVQGSRSQGAAPPFPCLPTSLSRQHLPDREPGSFTPPAGVAGFGPPASRVPSRQGTPPSTARATSPENPTAVIVASNQGRGILPTISGQNVPATVFLGPGRSAQVAAAWSGGKSRNLQVLSFVPGYGVPADCEVKPAAPEFERPSTERPRAARASTFQVAKTASRFLRRMRALRVGAGDGELRAAPAAAGAQTQASKARRGRSQCDAARDVQRQVSLRVCNCGDAVPVLAQPDRRNWPRAIQTTPYRRRPGRSVGSMPPGRSTQKTSVALVRHFLNTCDAEDCRRARLQRELRMREERLEGRERNVTARESDLVSREKRVADREADLAKMFDRLTEREEQQRKESQSRLAELSSKEEGLKLQLQDARDRNADLHCRQADLDQREAKLRAEEERERCRDLKRGLDERDARWHEAAKDASLVLKPHLKPRMSPRGKENVELQRQLEEQRGLMHKIKRKQDSWAAEGLEESGRGHRDSFGSEETVTGPGY
ncbi:unnamed protein product [Symbiodinium sp. CCMP2456]|nr:unnamed protein product [Symbiodinium sp. CCMP2456]